MLQVQREVSVQSTVQQRGCKCVHTSSFKFGSAPCLSNASATGTALLRQAISRGDSPRWFTTLTSATPLPVELKEPEEYEHRTSTTCALYASRVARCSAVFPFCKHKASTDPKTRSLVTHSGTHTHIQEPSNKITTPRLESTPTATTRPHTCSLRTNTQTRKLVHARATHDTSTTNNHLSGIMQGTVSPFPTKLFTWSSAEALTCLVLRGNKG